MKTCCKLVLNYALVFSLMNLTTFKLIKANDEDVILNSQVSLEAETTALENKNDLQATKQIFEKNKVAKIKNLNQLAELEFLNADLSKAYLTYESISHLALDSIWPDNIRQIIFQSFFRMAQIKKNEEQSLVSNAVVFASDLEPNKETTPPQLYKLFQEIKNNPSYITLNFKTLNKPIINGSSQVVKVHKDKIYRLDSMTENSQPITDFVVGSKISSYNPRLKKASLYLDTLQASTLSNATTGKALAKTDATRGHLTPEMPTELPTKLPLKLTPGLTDSEPLNFTATSDFNTTTKLKSKSNRKWIYIASSVLAVTLGAMLINQSNDSSDSYEPTSKQGF